MMTDPIADMLTRIRNANTAMHDEVRMPSSKQKEALAAILKKEGYIEDFTVADNGDRPGSTLTVTMKYSPERARTISGLRRVSKPGLRVYSPAKEKVSICVAACSANLRTLPEYVPQLGVLVPLTHPLYRWSARDTFGDRLIRSARMLVPWQILESIENRSAELHPFHFPA